MVNFSIFAIIGLFLISALAVWFAGVTLTKTVSTLDSRYKLGDALGGLILLGITGSLPEIAVVYGAARDGNTAVIFGNLIGGLSIQILLLVIFDFILKKKHPLSYIAGSLLMSLETFFAVALTILVIIGMFLPAKSNLLHFNPFSILVLIAWIVGIWFINKERKKGRFNVVASDADPGRRHHERRATENHPFYRDKTNLHIILIFLFAAVVTFSAGILLEKTSVRIADYFNISVGIFAATIISLVTALPEISTGIESILIGDNQLAISDIVGSNAFMLTLFVFADFAAQKPVLSYATSRDLFLAILAIVLMLIYAFSFLIHPKKRHWRLGFDSILVIVIYVLGLFLLSTLR